MANIIKVSDRRRILMAATIAVTDELPAYDSTIPSMMAIVNLTTVKHLFLFLMHVADRSLRR